METISQASFGYLLPNDDVGVIYAESDNSIELKPSKAPTEWEMTGKKRWILMEQSVDIDGRVNVTGDANLILPDGVTLTVSGGIHVPHGSSLTIWAESRDPETMGQLIVGADDGPGIGGFNGAAGSVTINGGKVTAKGGANAAGIGGVDSYPVENIAINRGIVSATGGSGAAGIGSAKGTVWSIVLNGDDVFAEGGSSAAGIGAGTGGHVMSVSIDGGKVEAIGHGGAGIGFGSRRGSISSIDISSGVILARGDTFGIGSYASDAILLVKSLIGVSPEKDRAYDVLDGAYFAEGDEEPVKAVLVDRGYKVNVAEGVQNASIKPDWTAACEGTHVTVTVDPDSGYACNELLVNLTDGSMLALEPSSPNTFEFTMPACDVVLEADIYGVDASEITILDGAPEIKSSNMGKVANNLLGAEVTSKYLELVSSPLKGTAAADDKAALVSKANELGATAGTWFDLSLFVSSRKDGTHLEQLTKTDEPLDLLLTVPKSLRAAGRMFYVLSVHDGVAKEVAQGTGKSLEWSCSEFSTFLLAYSDESASPVEVITIGFDANGGSGSMNPIFAQAGESVVLEANKFTCDGYSFDGWNTDKDGKGTAYADKATVKAEEDMTLYAQWKVPSSTTAKTGTASSKSSSSSSSSSSSTPKTNDAMPITTLFMLLCVSAVVLGASRARLNRKGSRR